MVAQGFKGPPRTARALTSGRFTLFHGARPCGRRGCLVHGRSWIGTEGWGSCEGWWHPSCRRPAVGRFPCARRPPVSFQNVPGTPCRISRRLSGTPPGTRFHRLPQVPARHLRTRPRAQARPGLMRTAWPRRQGRAEVYPTRRSRSAIRPFWAAALSHPLHLVLAVLAWVRASMAAAGIGRRGGAWRAQL